MKSRSRIDRTRGKSKGTASSNDTSKSKELLSKEIVSTFDDRQKKVYDALVEKKRGVSFTAINRKTGNKHNYQIIVPLVGETYIFDNTHKYNAKFSSSYWHLGEHTSDELVAFLKGLDIKRVTLPKK